MSVARFDYEAPRSLPEACRLLCEAGGRARVMAGGTDLMIELRDRLPAAGAESLVVSLRRIPGLAALEWDPVTGLTIGATARLSDVANHGAVNRHYPAIAYAASRTGTPQIRNMGTVVGNVCNAAPSADNIPSLMVLDARLLIAALTSSRETPLSEFFRGPGMTALAPGEIVTAIAVPPPPPRSGAAYLDLSARGQVDISSVGVAAMVVLDEEGACSSARIALGAVAPTPLRACEAEEWLVGRALEEATVQTACVLSAAEACPITDTRASEDYRRKVLHVLVERALRQAHERARANAAGDGSGEVPAGGREAR